MGRHYRVKPFEHVANRGLAPRMQCAVALGLLLRGDHCVEDFRFGLLMPGLRPRALLDEVLFQTDHRIAERPSVGFGLGPVDGRIVRGGMRSDPVGDIFDQGGAQIAMGPLNRPFRHGVNGKVIVTVHPGALECQSPGRARRRCRTRRGRSLETSKSPIDC